MIRCYLLPKIHTGTPPAWWPKYIEGRGLRWAGMDYGLEDVFLIAADVTQTEHDFLAAQADAVVVPPLTDTVGAALETVQAQLEARRLPADWITSGMSYRAVVRGVAQLCWLMQRFRGRERRTFFESGVTLDTRINALTAAQRSALTSAAQSLGLDVADITGPTTVREALTRLAAQLPAPILLGEV